MSRLADMQARFQQKQMQEKEEKLLKLYESQQQRAFERVGRGSAGHNISGGTSPVGAGKVRQMFDERRQKAGIDRSYPLEPLKQTKTNGYAANTNRVPNNLDRANNLSRTTVTKTSNFKQTVQRSITQTRTGKPPITYAARQTAEATFVNGELKHGNIEYAVHDSRNDKNGNDPMEALRNQEKELEIMMKSHRIDDEEYSDSEDVVDRGVEEDEIRPMAIENGNVNENYKEKISNGNHRKPIETTSASCTPVKKNITKTSYGAKYAEKTKKPINKTQSTPVKPISPTQNDARNIHTPPSRNSTHSSSPTSPEKKPQMKSSVQKPQQRSATSRLNAQPTAKPTPPASRSVPNQGQRPAASPRLTQPSIARDELKPCQYCNRRFAVDRIGLHEEICARTLKKKRKTYDPVKHRVQGTEAENYVRKNKTSSKSTKPQHISKSDWRRQHEEFISAIRAAKEAQAHVARGGKLSDLPPPPPSYNPDYVQCPHCGRRFNEAAAARHIPKCATMLHNKPNRLAPNPSKKRV